MRYLIILAIALFSYETIAAQVQMGQNGMQGPPMNGQMPPKDGMRPPMKDGQKPPKQKKQKKQKVEEEDVMSGKVAGQVYMFGFSEQFGDSIVYFSPICMVDSIAVYKKFLPYRSDFSEQFKNHLETHKGCEQQTSSVFFSDDRKKLAKTFYKLKKRYLEKDGRKIEILEENEFKFIHPLDYVYE